MKDWVSIYSSASQQESEMIKGFLTHNEINSVVVNKQDSLSKFGEFEVFVNRDDVVKAKFYLSQTRSEGEGLNP